RTPDPTLRSWGAMAVTGPDGLVYVAGGGTTVVEAYDPKTDQWTAKAPMNASHGNFGFVLGPDQRLYAIGGNGAETDVEAYDVATDTWTNVASLLVGRYYATAVTGSDGKIYVMGGGDDSCGDFNEVE